MQLLQLGRQWCPEKDRLRREKRVLNAHDKLKMYLKMLINIVSTIFSGSVGSCIYNSGYQF